MKILCCAIVLLASVCHAGEVVTSFGPTVDTNVGGRDHYVFDISVAKTTGIIRPYVSIETLFGQLNGQGTFNPTSTKYGVGVTAQITDTLSIVLDHYSRHSVDHWRPTEKFTAFKLQHRFEF